MLCRLVSACTSVPETHPSAAPVETSIETTEAAKEVWVLPSPNEKVCQSATPPVVIGNSFDGRLENALNIQDELSKLPWKNVYVFLSARDYQWGTTELCVVLATLGQYLYERHPGMVFDIHRTPVIGIGDIAAEKGRRLHRHLTHQTGIEADVFYLRRHSPDKELPRGHRWNRNGNRFPEKLLVKKRRWSPNFDPEENFAAFAFLQKKFGAWITTDRNMIWHIRQLKSKLDPVELARFMENSKHVAGHLDHFHLGLRCLASQPNCQSEWDKWHRWRRAGRKWKFKYGR